MCLPGNSPERPIPPCQEKSRVVRGRCSPGQNKPTKKLSHTTLEDRNNSCALYSSSQVRTFPFRGEDRGSNPLWSEKQRGKGRLAEWLKASALKADGSAELRGSNPLPSALGPRWVRVGSRWGGVPGTESQERSPRNEVPGTESKEEKKRGRIAQLVEHWFCIPKAVGSTPALSKRCGLVWFSFRSRDPISNSTVPEGKS